MIRMRARGVNEARLFLQQVGKRTSRAIRDEMIAVANDTADLAEDMAPYDTKSLERSIEVVPQPSGSHRFHISIIAGGNGVINPYSQVSVAEYAAIVHENYEDYATGEEAQRRVRRKEARTGQKVGSKFLERALAATDQTLADRLGRVLLLIGGIEK